MEIMRDLAGVKTPGIVTLEDVLDLLIGNVRETKLPGISCAPGL
jgi:hypothetical protein